MLATARPTPEPSLRVSVAIGESTVYEMSIGLPELISSKRFDGSSIVAAMTTVAPGATVAGLEGDRLKLSGVMAIDESVILFCVTFTPVAFPPATTLGKKTTVPSVATARMRYPFPAGSAVLRLKEVAPFVATEFEID